MKNALYRIDKFLYRFFRRQLPMWGYTNKVCYQILDGRENLTNGMYYLASFSLFIVEGLGGWIGNGYPKAVTLYLLAMVSLMVE